MFLYHRRLRIELLEDRRLLANVTVSNLNDVVNGNTTSIAALVADNGGDGISLREAVLAANADAAADTIDFSSLTGTIQLTNVGHAGEIAITNNLTINGPGATALTVRAFMGTAAVGDGARIFNVDDSNGSGDKTVTISGLALTGGDPAGSSSGGAIRTAENLTVSSSTISGNTALFGGGIAKVGSTGQLTVSASTISSNAARSTGGGIDTRGGSLSVSQSTISRNEALFGSGAGGGIFCSNTPTTIDSSTISGNEALVSGGVQHAGIGILMTITNSTISGNLARGDAGGVAAFYGNVSIRHSTITGNRADSDGTATGNGGGLFVTPNQSNVTLDHTIVAGNLRGFDTPSRDDIFRSVAARYCLIGVNTGATITNNGGNQIGTSAAPIDPRLAPLGNNGGPTLTHALLAASPALDRGDPAATAGVGTVPLTDQRGAAFARITDGDGDAALRIDIGAFEQQTTTPAHFVVDTLDDLDNGNHLPGDLSLREAIGLANATIGADTITFAPALTSGGPATIQLIGELVITDHLTISGPGATLLTIRAFGGDTNEIGDGARIFTIDDGNNAAFKDISISGLKVAGGDIPASGFGGAIFNAENLTVTDSTISGNFVVTQGSDNHDGRGGAIYNTRGNLTIAGSTISANICYGLGGGIWNNLGNVVISGSTISGNVGTLGGGGIFSYLGNLTVANSTISGNGTFTGGGGIYSAGGGLTVTNSTISENQSGNLIGGKGGGILHSGDAATVRHSTIAFNGATEGLHGVPVGGGFNGPVALDHTIVTGNTRGGGVPDDVVGAGPISFSQIGIGQEFLGPLADNGGPTMTHALLAGSPAIDAGDPAAVAGVGTVPEFDQRGFPFTRVIDGDGAGGPRIDIGAFELHPLPPTPPDLLGDYNRDNAVDAADYVVWRKTLGSGGLAAFAGADGSGNGLVDQPDYGLWREHFGQTLPASTARSGAGEELSVEGRGASAETTAAPAETDASAARAAIFNLLETESIWQGSGSLSRAKVDRYLVGQASGGGLSLLLAIDRVERSLRQDQLVSDDSGSDRINYDEKRWPIDQLLTSALEVPFGVRGLASDFF